MSITVYQTMSIDQIFSDSFREQKMPWVKKTMKADVSFRLPAALHDLNAHLWKRSTFGPYVVTSDLHKFEKAIQSLKDIWKCPANYTENILNKPQNKLALRIWNNNFYCKEIQKKKKPEDTGIPHITISPMKKHEGLKSPATVCGAQKTTTKTYILKLHITL